MPVARHAYAHDAVVAVERGGDLDALGGAIAAALCGSWDHPPPCPVPHHVSRGSAGDLVTVRVLFATGPGDELRVRSRIDEALAAGQLTGPDGRITVWQLQSTAAGEVRPSEQEHAGRLIAHGEAG